MTRVAHIIGNGDNAQMYKPAKGLKITCNVPPFEVANIYTTTIVDFKMMNALKEGSVQLPLEWVCGFRPKRFMEMYPNFYLKHAAQIKEFYLDLPSYTMKAGETQAQGYTNFNCGHFATHYAANKLKCNEIHMYGFDSIFDFNLRSTSDFVLNSDRGDTNNNRLINNWRPIWQGIFNEFKDTQFVLYHKHDQLKFNVPENVEVRTKN